MHDIVYISTHRIESVELKVTDPVTLKGSMVSGGKDGSVKYWDLTKCVVALLC